MAGAIERARDDISNGRLWKARDRLSMLVKQQPANREALLLLGEVHHAMGDLPMAGRFWILTDRSGPDAEAAAAALEERWGGSPRELVRMLPRGPLDEYPAPARERIAALRARARVGPDGEAPETDEEPIPAPSSERLWLAAFALLGPGLWLLGVGTAIYLLVGLLA
jgi:uncharacterized protein DUF6584